MILLLQILKHFLFTFLLVVLELFSGTICNFESYGASVGFGFDNSKAFSGGCFNSFEDSVISYDFNIIAIGV